MNQLQRTKVPLLERQNLRIRASKGENYRIVPITGHVDLLQAMRLVR